MNQTAKISKLTTIDLQTCPVCGSGQAYPSEQRQTGNDCWQLTMSCPNCFAWREATIDTQALNSLGCDLCRAQEALREQLTRLESKHMRQAADAFISALYAGHIQPIDF